MRNSLLQQRFLWVRQLDRRAETDIHDVNLYRYWWDYPIPLSMMFRWSERGTSFFETAVDYDEVPVKRSSLKGHRYRGEPLLREKGVFGYDRGE